MQKFVAYCVLFANLQYPVSSSLETVHLIFRHGERCPDHRFMHPKDPYRNKTFAPYGQGQITNLGKEEVYNLGLDIRKRYKSFIGDGYNYSLVDPWSTALPRGQATLMLVLAGIFKPHGHEIWNKELLWQPVPFKYITRPDDDDMFLAVLLSKQYIEEYKRSFDRNGKYIMETHKRTIQSIKDLIELDITDSKHAFALYMSTLTEDCVGYPLPEWFTSIKDDFEKLAVSDYKMQISTRTLQRLAIGNLLRKIVEDTKAKLKNESKYKLHMYSAHDFNIAHVLLLLNRGVDVTHFIPYAACVALEVHNYGENSYEVHVVYKNGSDSNWETITILPFQMLEGIVEGMFETQTMGSGNTNCLHIKYLFLSTIFAFLLYK